MYPQKIEILEVCPRDGFQNVVDFIPTDKKIDIVKSLVDANFKRIEVGSFVSPKAIPQMADSKEVITAIREYAKGKDLTIVSLVPNARGVENAIDAKADQITYAISVSEAHNKANVNRTVAESKEQYEGLINQYKSQVDFRLGLATTFGCPFGEDITVERVMKMVEWALNIGTKEVLMADTVGLGNPKKVDAIIKAVTDEFGPEPFVMHLHDTRGLALANSITAMKYGVTKFESAAGGLGGCPFAPGASGNLATEDLYYMLNEMGIETEINIEKVYEAIDKIRENVHANLSGHMAFLRGKETCKA